MPIVALLLAACDQATSPVVAQIGGPTNINSGGLVISPGRVTLMLGSGFQFSTNAVGTQRTQIQWASSNTTVATVSPSGFVNAVGPGTSTIFARYSFDTTNVASSLVEVIGPSGSTGNAAGFP